MALNLSGNGIVTANINASQVVTATIADANVTTAKIANANVTPAKLSQPFTIPGGQNASSTSVLFTGIPSWSKRVTMNLYDVSTNGTSIVICRVGSGSIATSGYVSACHQYSNAQATSVTSFILNSGRNSASADHGTITLSYAASNIWVGVSNISVGGSVACMGGSVVLGGVLDRVSLTTVNGTDTFDTGSVHISYEG
jgi:hypothetical protein